MAADAEFPVPDAETDPGVVVLRLLDFHRRTVLEKVRSLPEGERRRSRVPSGWTPLELVLHLIHVEQRWLVWGFLGEPVEQPWGDDDGFGRWHVADDVTLDDLVSYWDRVAERSASVLASTRWEERAAVGGRFDTDPPTLAAIALHVLQEHARHAGHLDVAVELAGGPTGE